MGLVEDSFIEMRDRTKIMVRNRRLKARDRVLSFKRMFSTAIIPSMGSSHAAGFDLYYCGDVADRGPLLIPAGEIRIVPCGVGVALPCGYHGQVWGRSGNATKKFLTTEAGIIDEDYRGELGAICANRSNADIWIEHGERVAQMVVVPNFMPNEELFVYVCTADEDLAPCGDRGDRGFGSTGD